MGSGVDAAASTVTWLVLRRLTSYWPAASRGEGPLTLQLVWTVFSKGTPPAEPTDPCRLAVPHAVGVKRKTWVPLRVAISNELAIDALAESPNAPVSA